MFFLPKMQIMLHAWCIDPAIGRFSKHSLSQQILMELLIAQIETKERICRSNENPDEIRQWDGVDVNEAGDVLEIHLSSANHTGCLDVQWIPDTVVTFNVYGNRLEGTIDVITVQDSSLKRLVLGYNGFSGPFPLEFLPKSLTYLDICKNKFEGSVNLQNLPSSIMQIFAYGNKFEGSICLDDLPDGFKTISLNKNFLSGTVSLKKLPASMDGVFLADNELSGTLDLTQLPASFVNLNLTKNNFHGSVLIRDIPNNRFNIWIGMNPLLEGEMRFSREAFSRITTDGTNIERVILE